MERRDLAEDTILVITTDHGVAMPRAKGTLYDPGIETLLFMRYPGGGWKTGVRLQELISNVDILPTLLEACGIDVPENVQGHSFLPLLTGGAYEPRDCVFAEKTFHGTYDPVRCVRTDTHKYICFFEKSTLERVPGDVMHYGMFVEWGPAVMREGRERLYDLQADPDETNNLADDPAFEETKNDLRARLVGWMEATNDPILDGPVASPYYHETMRMLGISRGQFKGPEHLK